MGYKDKEKQRRYQREWMRKRRQYYFKDKECIDCGSRENLEIDHIDPNKKWTHSFWSYSWEKIYKELEKCQILCSSCHKQKTFTKDLFVRFHHTASGIVPYKWVYYERNKYRSKVSFKSKKYHLGMFDCPIEAAKAADKKFLELTKGKYKEYTNEGLGLL